MYKTNVSVAVARVLAKELPIEIVYYLPVTVLSNSQVVIQLILRIIPKGVFNSSFSEAVTETHKG